MKTVLLVVSFIISLAVDCQPVKGPAQPTYLAEDKVANDFKKMLGRPASLFRPSFLVTKSDSVIIERGFFYSEATEKVPVVLYKPVAAGRNSYPVVICLHGTGGSKDDDGIKDLMYRLSKIGIMGVAIDARYHGERIGGGAHKSAEYVEAIRNAWQDHRSSASSHPFYYDTVYDLWRLVDYLVTRADVIPSRIGMMGISMGGIETWMAASVDKRIKVAVPVIATQSFQWSLQHNKWQGRAGTIWAAHQQVARDLGDTAVTMESVNALWAKIVPGIAGEFDCPSMIRLFAPRALMLLNNEKDQNCPLEGAQIAFESATNAYRSKRALDKLKIQVTPNEPHRFLPQHATMAIDWFRRWL